VEVSVARTHSIFNGLILAASAAFIIGSTAACENTARGVQQDAAELEVETRDERAEAAASARELARDAAEVGRAAGAMARDAGEALVERTGGAVNNVTVKSALMADASVDASRIDVDVNTVDRSITLNGYVPTDTERARAEAIARDKSDGYTVHNNLTVQPRF
jgi:osmotically-inducible protein OsmY